MPGIGSHRCATLVLDETPMLRVLPLANQRRGGQGWQHPQGGDEEERGDDHEEASEEIGDEGENLWSVC